MKICDRCGSSNDIKYARLMDGWGVYETFSRDLCKKCRKKIYDMVSEFIEKGDKDE